MSKALEGLREALYGTGLVQPIDSKGRGGSVSCLCRQIPGQEANWLKVVDQLLTVSDQKSIDLHICRRYVRREGRMVFGWFLGVETKNAKDVVEAVGFLVEVLKQAKPSLAPIPEQPVRPYQSQYRDRTTDAEKQALELGKHGTKAPPRAPEYVGPDPQPPQNVVPRLTVISRGVDKKGRTVDEVEMPLPHVYSDLNAPKHKDGKGAKGISGD